MFQLYVIVNSQADCVKFYSAKLAKCEEQCENEKLTVIQRAIGIAFVTFTTESMASRYSLFRCSFSA